MTNDTILPFSFPAVQAKKVTAAFDGGRLTSNGGVMLLAMAERRLGLADNLARVFPDRRDPTRVVHSLVDMFRARMFAICCGYEDADDLDHLRSDPAFKLACGRLPDTGRDLCSQPTLSRLENSPRLRDVIRLTYTLVDAWMDSYPGEPASVTLDIDDTCDVVHGHQQLSLFNAHYDEVSITAEQMLASAKWKAVSWRSGTKGRLKARFAALRVRTADGPPQRIWDKGQQHL